MVNYIILGACLEKYDNYKLIKEKNFKIIIIDIDERYVRAT